MFIDKMLFFCQYPTVYVIHLNRTIKINKYLSKSLFILLAGTACVSAYVPVLTNENMGDKLLGFQVSNSTGNSMYLGQWRDQILSKLNPRYFDRLVNKRFKTSMFNSGFLNVNFLSNFSDRSNNFIASVFTDNFFKVLDESNIYFSFASDIVKYESPIQENSLSNFNSLALGSKYSKPTLLEQEYYTPGYIISNGNSSFGIAAILVQQSFLDDSLGFTTVATSSRNFVYFEKTQRLTNRGTGYQFNFTQKLVNGIDISVDYQSQINMNEFDAYGRSYSDQGEFDIPSQYTFSLGVPVFSNKMIFSAEKISYSNIDYRVHSGFSEAFLAVYNGTFAPIYKLQDLTVYSVSFEQNINSDFSWSFEVTSRQQAPATKEIYDRILTEDTASISYKLGISHSAPIGQFNFYASFANKPLFIGTTDFGRFNTSLDQHIEGVASWSFQF